MTVYGVLLLLLMYFFPPLHQFSVTATKKPLNFVNANDKQALLAFKNNLDNGSHVLSSWNESSSYCKWKGVSCCRWHPERVCAIELLSSNLAGSISPYIGNLSFLRDLYLTSNELYGAIPLSIGHLSRLQNLGLGNNSLSGTFPPNLYNCSKIRTLALSYNQLSGELPPWLGHFRKLEILYLGVNNFMGGIPLSIGNLSSLQGLDLVENHLGGSIPDNLGELSQLKTLNLGVNNFSGVIPKSIYNLTFLSTLALPFNNLQGHLQRNMGTRLPNLQQLFLDSNQLTGEIPASLSNASFMQELDLSSNNFSGTIPEVLGQLCPSYFNVYSNELEAELPEDWNFIKFFTNCSVLEVLSLGQNNFGGSIPGSIVNLTSQLQTLNLQINHISGEIPSGIENLVGLVKLSFAINHLRGIIPTTIGKLRNLQLLGLAENEFSGPIPSSIGNLTKLSLLFAGNNHLVASIPSSIENLTQLIGLHVDSNNLTGMLPKSMFNILTLVELGLSDNFLSGAIPEEIGNLKNLVHLYLWGNNFTGELPERLGDCQILTNIAFDSNSFNGVLPAFLSKLKGLEFLGLSHNYFSGAIPEELGLVRDLQELDLSENHLSGHIPLALENLTHLYMLDISYNNIEGPVPTKGVFSNRSAITLVGNNRLCGGIPELNLPKCLIQPSRKPSRKHLPMLLKLVIPIVGTTFLLALLLLTFLVPKWKRKLTRKSTTDSVLKDRLPKVTYGELAEATNSFADSNLIGAGKYGRVYKGILQFKEEGSSNQETHTVAIKVFDLRQLGSSKSFVAECEALRIIRHRNLIQIITCCSTIDYKGNNFKALVFDYVPNGNLHTWLHPEIEEEVSSSPLGLRQRLNIAIDIADALHYLHHNCQPSVIHCDIKPSNILLSEDWSACVGDFGLAKLLQDPISKSLVESESSMGIRGSIGYVPPEYGEGGPVSTAGDVYSFGVLLLELFTGRNPTEYMFKDGLTLRTFVNMAFPERVMEIVDPNLIAVDATDKNPINKNLDCLLSIIEVGLACSMQSPVERISMESVATQLHKIKVGTGKGQDERVSSW